VMVECENVPSKKKKKILDDYFRVLGRLFIVSGIDEFNVSVCAVATLLLPREFDPQTPSLTTIGHSCLSPHLQAGCSPIFITSCLLWIVTITSKVALYLVYMIFEDLLLLV
jgi:hypothetical protein